MKKRAFNIIRILVSISLISYLVFRYRVDLKNFFTDITVNDINFWFLVLAAMMHVTGLLISSIRWKILLGLQDVSAGINYLNGSLLVGIFLNNFLPSSIGGDAYRAYDTSRLENSNWPKSITVILMERGMGVIALIVFAFISLPLGFKLTGFKNLFIIITVILVLLVIFLILIMNPSSLKIFNFIFKIRFMGKLKQKLRDFTDAFSAFKHRKPLYVVILLSFVMQLNVILHYYFSALALKIEIDFISFLFMVPIVLVVAMIPVSIGGLGIRENTTIYFLNTLGISGEKAVAFPLLILIMLLLESLIGGIILLIRRPGIFS
ncbi:MAG: flippase-like domain-containing protein [Actinobacteria bacterium]|nr:flippase-like domain-containing protein [Actinomycetota bacterium]